MHQNLEHGRARRQRIEAALFDCVKQELTGVYVITPESATMHFLDAGGTPRFVMLPELNAAGGQMYFVMNTGDEDLVVLDAGGVEVAVVGPASGTFFLSSPEEWQSIQQIASDGDLAAIEALTGAGFLVRTGTGAVWELRGLIPPAAGFDIIENTGVSGNPTFVLADDLAALEGLSGTGVPRRTGSDTWMLENRKIVATSDLTFWVKLSGNDVSGLEPSAVEPGNAGCYLTWEFAIADIASRYDWNGFTITVKAAGTGVRTWSNVNLQIPDWRGGGVLALVGDSSNVNNVRLEGTVQNLILWSNDAPSGALSFDFLRLKTTHADGRAINHRSNGRMLLRNVHFFENLDAGLFVNNDGSYFQIQSGCTIQFTTLALTETGILVDSGRGNTDGTILFNGGATFANTFLEINFNGWMYTSAWSGTFTGVSYNVKDGGGLRIGLSAVPGSIAGINQPGTCVSDAAGVTLSSGDIWGMGSVNGGRLVKTLGTDGKRLEETSINVDSSNNMSAVKSISTTANIAVGTSLTATTTITATGTLIGLSNLQITTTASVGGNLTVGGQITTTNFITTGTGQIGTNLTAAGAVTFGSNPNKNFWSTTTVGAVTQRQDSPAAEVFVVQQNFSISAANQGIINQVTFGAASASISSASQDAVLSIADYQSAGAQSVRRRFNIRTSGSLSPAVDFQGLGMIAAPTNAIPAGGDAQMGYKFSATANYGVFFGSSLPTLSAAQGSIYSRSNHTTLWVNTDGATSWRALPCTLAQSAVQAQHTGNTTETVLATVTLPGNAMGANGRVQGKVTASCTNSANLKTWRVRLGGIGGTIITEIPRGASEDGYTFLFGFANRNATNSQIGDYAANGSGVGSHGATPPPTATVDTTTNQTIVITGQLASAGEQIRIESYLMMLFPG